MKQQWQAYCEKFLKLTRREQYMIIAVGFMAVSYIPFSFFIDENTQQVDKLTKQISKIKNENSTTEMTIGMLEEGLAKDPNVLIRNQIKQYKKRLSEVDNKLLSLTTDLINPIEMRVALMQLLKTQSSVSLLSFEVIPATTLSNLAGDADHENSLSLYKHGIRVKLKGSYFQLKSYLSEVEAMPWKFFWQEFNYQLQSYPDSELEIEMYSLSTSKEFIGV